MPYISYRLDLEHKINGVCIKNKFYNLETIVANFKNGTLHGPAKLNFKKNETLVNMGKSRID